MGAGSELIWGARGVSVDTLRRWDKSGKLIAVRKEGGTHRYYTRKDLEIFLSNLLKLAHDWVFWGQEIAERFYCANSAIFQARLVQMESELIKFERTSKNFSLIVAIAGEIGNNSFDHNLGNWPDVPGIFFGYDVHKGIVVLADRGLGVLETLKRVRPELKNHTGAVEIAFTEVVSGRAPEARGNGLKFVRSVIEKNSFNLFFQSGDAELRIQGNDQSMKITRSQNTLKGCLAVITF